VEPLHVDGEADPRYVQVTLARLQVGAVTTRIRDLKSKVQRINPVAHKDEYLALAGELFSSNSTPAGVARAGGGGCELLRRRPKLPAAASGRWTRQRVLSPGAAVRQIWRGVVANPWHCGCPDRVAAGWHEIHKGPRGRAASCGSRRPRWPRTGRYTGAGGGPVATYLLLSRESSPTRCGTRVTPARWRTRRTTGCRSAACGSVGPAGQRRDGLTWSVRYDAERR
jgi:hypothetical protein